MHHHNGSYIMFGDMNAVRNEQERVGSIFNNIEADHFNSFIDATGLVDLPIGGRCFTWMNKAGTKLNKLDRFLISKDVINLLPDIRITILDRIWSDHNPILLHVDKIDFGPSPKTMDRNRKAVALEEITSIEKKIDEGSASPSDTENRLNLLHELEKIDNTDRDYLERLVTLEKIKEAVWDYGSSKAPGPDGFSFAFVKKYWDIIQKDLHDFINSFFASNSDLDINGVLGLKSVFHLQEPLFLLMVALRLNSLSIEALDKEIPISFSFYPGHGRDPELVLQDLKRIRSNFFWGGNQDGKKMAWVKWPIILNSLDKGGLNIGSLKAFNLALLQKWRWRMFSSSNDLWVKVVKAFHGHEGGFDNNGCSFNVIFDFRLELVPLSLLVSGDVILSTVRSSTKHNLVSPSCDFVIL
ncbi:RNA-directed DNA polymerase, eukaryota, reverse transcriptase zinc-binding domain protein [Tanacetum coccineum]